MYNIKGNRRGGTYDSFISKTSQHIPSTPRKIPL